MIDAFSRLSAFFRRHKDKGLIAGQIKLSVSEQVEVGLLRKILLGYEMSSDQCCPVKILKKRITRLNSWI
jgi:hypothetical protein